ncbi:transposase [Streptomyces sp. NPDC006294]|uniref:transposase n=1 Tax=Streptomyces sp. NPDC006294 TaxID=3364743 RepID=UPI003673D6A1
MRLAISPQHLGRRQCKPGTMPELPLDRMAWLTIKTIALAYVTGLGPNPDARTGRHVVHNLHIHLAFVTQYRRNAFTDAMPTRAEEIMWKVCADFQADLNSSAANGTLPTCSSTTRLLHALAAQFG